MERLCVERGENIAQMIMRGRHGPVFRPVDRHGRVATERLSGEAVSLIVKERVAAAGIDASGFSGHSLRAGFATSATLAGVSSLKIRAQTGHASDAMLARYVRDGENVCRQCGRGAALRAAERQVSGGSWQCVVALVDGILRAAGVYWCGVCSARGRRAMKQRIKIIFIGGVLALALFGVAMAGPLEDGAAAFQRGDYATAMSFCRPLADQGNADAQALIGVMYEAGEGVPQDYPQAAMLFRKAADQGLAPAQYFLGEMYENGQGGVPQDYAQAYTWYKLAASNAADDRTRDMDVKARDSIAARMAASGIPSVTTTNASAITFEEQGGTFVLPVLINNAITLSFVVDSGAADVSIPRDVFSTLIRSNTISQADIIGRKTYRLADGSTSVETTFRIRVLKVGDRELQNVTASVPPETGSLLLGQSFLSRFKSWSIDNQRHVLLLN